MWPVAWVVWPPWLPFGIWTWLVFRILHSLSLPVNCPAFDSSSSVRMWRFIYLPARPSLWISFIINAEMNMRGYDPHKSSSWTKNFQMLGVSTIITQAEWVFVCSLGLFPVVRRLKPLLFLHNKPQVQAQEMCRHKISCCIWKRALTDCRRKY